MPNWIHIKATNLAVPQPQHHTLKRSHWKEEECTEESEESPAEEKAKKGKGKGKGKSKGKGKGKRKGKGLQDLINEKAKKPKLKQESRWSDWESRQK